MWFIPRGIDLLCSPERASLSYRPVDRPENQRPRRRMMQATDLKKELAKLDRMSVSELRTEYQRQFGDTTTVGNKQWLHRRIAWRIQEKAEGGLSERAKRRAAE